MGKACWTVAVACLVACLSVVAIADDDDGTIRLFNGEDLSGWIGDFPGSDTKLEDVFSVRDGLLVCTGQPAGVIRTEANYENYRISLQWRWPDRGGNNGLLVHTTDSAVFGPWPRSIEVQLAHGNAGDFWVIGTDMDVENEDERKQGRRHINLTDDSENALGEWNTMVVECRGDEVIVWVNDDLVNHATACTATSGAICLQSEGTPIEYREIVLTPLE